MRTTNFDGRGREERNGCEASKERGTTILSHHSPSTSYSSQPTTNSHSSQGTSDIPSAFFATELAATYPTAHIIHTTRPFASWAASMRRTLWASQSRRLETMAANPQDPIDPDWRLANTYWRVYWENDFDKTGEAKWKEHEAAMLKLRTERESSEQGKGKWLEFSIGMGFEELCSFLGKEVPRGEDGEVADFPNHDDVRLNAGLNRAMKNK